MTRFDWKDKGDLKWAEDLARIMLVNDHPRGVVNLCVSFLGLLDSHGELLAETSSMMARVMQQDIGYVTARAKVTELERELYAARQAAEIDSDEDIPLVEYIREMRKELGKR